MISYAGRHDHMQLSTPAMLGCLLSHMQIWQSVLPNEIVAVFEEDAYLDEVSAARMHALSRDLHSIPWDVLLLESGQQLISTGLSFSPPPSSGPETRLKAVLLTILTVNDKVV